MRTKDLLIASVRSLKRGGSRSILSILGIVIGIASVILILSISQAGQRFIIDQVASFGADLLFVENGSPDDAENISSAVFAKEVLSEHDYNKLKSLEWMRLISALIYQQDVATHGGETMNTEVVGTTEDEVEIYDVKMQTGTFFTEEDVAARRRVAVIGSDVAADLFGFDDPVGKLVEINKQKFRVTGVIEPTGTRFLREVDKQIFIPFTSVLDLYGREFVMAFVMKTTLQVDEGADAVRVRLRELHDIDDPKNDDFRLYTPEDTAEITRDLTFALQIFLVAVAAISLVVGGIGIMNIMYVSVTERTKEIGLLKSLGARTRSVLKQFLLESLFLTMIGGLIGMALGIALTWLAIVIISFYQDGWTFEISTAGIFLGIGFSTMIGLIFGYAPARKAARISPIEALRYE